MSHCWSTVTSCVAECELAPVALLVSFLANIVHQVTEAPGYEIHIGRSFAVYAWQWLADAAKEYGPVGTGPL